MYVQKRQIIVDSYNNDRRFTHRDYLLLFFGLFVSSWYLVPAMKVIIPSSIIALSGIVLLMLVTVHGRFVRGDFLKLLLAFFMLFFLYYFYTFEGATYKATGIITQMIVSFTPALLMNRIENNKKIKKLFFIIISIFVLFVVIRTAIELIVNPGVARLLAHAEVDGINTDYLRLQNIGGFGHAYGVVFIIVALAFCYKKTFPKKNKILILVLIVCGLWYIYLSEYFLALVLSLLGIVISFVMGVKDSKSKVLIIIICIFSLFLLPSVLSGLASITDGEISRKFYEVSQSLSNGSVQGVSSQARENVYRMSLNAFLQSPIWGLRGDSVLYSSVGGHSTILDFLGQTGIIGFSSYVLYVMFIFNTIHNYSIEYKTVFGLYIILGLLNPTMTMYEMSGFIYLFVPLLLEFVPLLIDRMSKSKYKVS